MEMKLALDVVGGFKIEHRGLTDVKGKGMLDTYYLCGTKANWSIVGDHNIIFAHAPI